jgi:hypothetical protein
MTVALPRISNALKILPLANDMKAIKKQKFLPTTWKLI